MYYLYQNIQDEIFDMLPKSRRKNEYCRFLPLVKINLKLIKSDRQFYINKYYDEIITVLSGESATSKYINKKKDHPKGPKCNYDHKTARYCWVNFVPAVFNTRGNDTYTIEFRPMQASTSYIKIKNWLLICFSLVDIVENHKNIIYDNPIITLNDIITACYPKNNKELIDYIELRKKKFLTAESINVETEDYIDNEIDNDFSQKGI